MKQHFYTPFKAFALFGTLSLTLIFASCGDSSTSSIEPFQNKYTSFDNLPNCTIKRAGEIVEVVDIDSFFICKNGQWNNYIAIDTAATEDGLLTCSKGNEGRTAFVRSEDAIFTCSAGSWEKTYVFNSYGEMVRFVTCSIASLEDSSGYKILCNGDSVGVLLNGKKGEKGEQGEPGIQGKKGDQGDKGIQGDKGDAGDNGTSCSVEAKADSSGYNVICGEKIVGTLVNGDKGEKGEDGMPGPQGEKGDSGSNCSVTQNNGITTIACGDDVVSISTSQISPKSSSSSVVSSSSFIPASFYGTCNASRTSLYIGDTVKYTYHIDTDEFPLSQYATATFSWDLYGSSTPSSNNRDNVSATYKQKGNYTAKLVINDDIDHAVYCPSVEVLGYKTTCRCTSSPVGTYNTYIDVTNGPVALTYNANCSSQGLPTFTYSWNESGYSNASSMTHILSDGTYQPTLSVRNSEGTTTEITSCPSFIGFSWENPSFTIRQGELKYMKKGGSYLVNYVCRNGSNLRINIFQYNSSSSLLVGSWASNQDNGTFRESTLYWPLGYDNTGADMSGEIVITLDENSAHAILRCE